MSACSLLHDEIADAALGKPPSTVLQTHLAGCAACTAELARQRAIVGRMESAVNAIVRARPPARLVPNTIASIQPRERAQRSLGLWPRLTLGTAVAAAVMAVLLNVHPRPPTALLPANSAALTAWRSPTGDLLNQRGSVVEAPLRDLWFDSQPRTFRSHRPLGVPHGA